MELGVAQVRQPLGSVRAADVDVAMNGHQNGDVHRAHVSRAGQRPAVLVNIPASSNHHHHHHHHISTDHVSGPGRATGPVRANPPVYLAIHFDPIQVSFEGQGHRSKSKDTW